MDSGAVQEGTRYVGTECGKDEKGETVRITGLAGRKCI